MVSLGGPAGLCSAAEWVMLPQWALLGERGNEAACAGGCGQLSSYRRVCVVQNSLCLGKAALSWRRKVDEQPRSITFCLILL